jgi:chromosome segregation ATPase
MKNFQQNLLVVLAIGLCALCAWQWYGQTLQRNQIQTLNQLVYDKSLAIRDYTNSIATLNHQIAQMDARITDLRDTAVTNEQLIVAQRREIDTLQGASEALEAKLKEAYDGINKQNEAIKEVVAQRDEFVKKFNDTMKERNEIVAKYNELAAQVEKQQGGSGKK